MRLLHSTDLALRMLMRLAVADAPGRGGPPATGSAPTTRQVAEDMAVPYTHAAKVAARLTHLGLVEARRGRGGGLVLTEAGRTASVGALVREFEGEGDVVECEGATPCPLNSGCRLRGALRRAQEAFYAALDPVTVEDIVASPTGPLLLGLASHRSGPKTS
ncbi:Rrf2 family transcriptional regulator [Streptomyces spectabilis]|uniref:Rrf2 family nitric oxide-sensitive transcriptional repressor n=1 Tax=Streptomyces spectabilis TaxID=68270 RepID=A0A5P2X8T6_STRST|nr:Rrf2 family transcriptional regulator [Streptomyces spectabilis]MBB5102978.1 Rrf2 family nitric oxide-sensitive transcriptional repressor [Streptomyces spectabilis]MCI3902173.1 Rrf2 family transcriptional regulator [Streptomyces spectabilis]QEV59555.1 Rrf2 family transcriptional regulator [Streptomyces spectabilis]GGV15529.1 HTH-type transcriptional repressor NsrR [Streptomyces spectabilis]